MWPVPAVVALVVLALLPAEVHSDDPVSSSITFNREVIRIFQKKCLACHAPGAAAMSLATYRDARPWARAIREELVERRMPPWSAAPGYGTFANDIGLTQREFTMLLTWTDGGVPKGDDRDRPRDAPSPAFAPMAAPDHRLALPAQRIPANTVVVRRVTVSGGAAFDRRLRRVRVVPGNTGVLRAAFVFIAPARRPARARASGATAGQWLAAWTPWHRESAPPKEASVLLPGGSDVVVELHYRAGDRPAEDRSSVELVLAPDGGPAAGEILLEAAVPLDGDSRARARGATTLKQDVIVWALLPQVPEVLARSSLDGVSLEVMARKPDGSADVLLWIPAHQPEWPTPYILRDPVLLPAGTVLSVTATHGRPVPRSRPGPPVVVRVSTVR